MVKCITLSFDPSTNTSVAILRDCFKFALNVPIIY